ncbi:MAG: sensor histidine kinase [Spirochaetaceae bacterium]|nr:sensor histidine kinase [Spirochaetaceae bacterium]
MLDLVQNSIEAESKIIRLNLNQSNESLIVELNDDGCGMTEEELKMATDPFYTDGKKHKHRKVGLGLPFLIQTLSMTEGRFDMSSEKGIGTSIVIEFNLKNIDTPPVGNIISLLYQVLCFDGSYSLIAERSFTGVMDSKSYTVNRNELYEVLGDLNSVSSLSLLRDFLTSQEEELKTSWS